MKNSSLKSQLNERRNTFNAAAPEGVKTVYEAGIQSVAGSGIIERAIQLGDPIPITN